MIEKSSQVVIKIKPKALRILRIVAKSEKPLSSGDIEKGLLGVTRLREKRDPQVYHILKDLCAQKFKYPCFLFDWNELVSSIKEAQEKRETSTFDRVRRSLVGNFNRIGWMFDNTIEFTRGDDSLIEIKTNDSSIIKIERDSKSKDHAVLRVLKNKDKKIAQETPLVVKTAGKKTGGSGLNIAKSGKEKPSNIKVQIFYEGIKGDLSERGISYLKTSLNEESRKKSERIRNIGRQRAIDYHKRKFTTPTEGEMWTTDQEDSILSKIEGDRSHWNYSLNTRGLILLVLGIVKEEYENRTRNVEISNILENLSENFKKDFPYVVYYHEIKKLYDGLAKEKKGYEYFQVNHLKQIALELQNVIETIDTQELDYYVTKHYSTRLTKDYIRYANGLLRPPQGIPYVIGQYFVTNLNHVRDYLEEEFKDAVCTIEAFLT